MKTKKPAAPQSSPLPRPAPEQNMDAVDLARKMGYPPDSVHDAADMIAPFLAERDRRVNQGPAFDASLATARIVMQCEDLIAADRDFPTAEQWSRIVKQARAALKLTQGSQQ